MKGLAVLFGAIAAPLRRWNVRLVVWLLVGLIVFVVAYSAAFNQLMAAEGRTFGWVSSVYWTLTTMSTLGYGDITFESDAGQAFSVFVLITGALYILVLLPFAFIQFIFAPWMDRREASRAPRKVPDDVSGHLVVTARDSVTQALIARARQSKIPHVILVSDPSAAVRLHDMGYRVMVGPLDKPETYRRAGIERAALVAATQADTTKTNIAFTVREINPNIPIVATADKPASVDVLRLAGCDHVIELASILGSAMARRVLGTTGHAHVVGEFGAVRIAEAGVRGQADVGKPLGTLNIGRQSGLTMLAVCEDGQILPPRHDHLLTRQSIIVIAGTDAQLAAYDRTHVGRSPSNHPVVILGGGRVGRAAAHVLDDEQMPYRIVEKEPGRVRNLGVHGQVIEGDASELDVLREAGIQTATAVLVTTHEDDLNVYLSLYGRRLRPDVQVIARAVHERNVTTLRRAGADSVLSYAALGATAMWNVLGFSHRVVLAEGIELFAVPVPDRLVGRPFHDPEVYRETGCYPVAALDTDATAVVPTGIVPTGRSAQLLIMGNRHGERRFRERYRVPARTWPTGRS